MCVAGDEVVSGSLKAGVVQALLLKLLDTWLDRFDSIGSSPARKLSALALCLLLPVPISAILQRLPDAIGHITAVYYEVGNACCLSLAFNMPPDICGHEN